LRFAFHNLDRPEKMYDFTEKTAENAEIAEIYQKNPGNPSAGSGQARVIRGFFQ